MSGFRTTNQMRPWQNPMLPPVGTTEQLTAKDAEAQSVAKHFPRSRDAHFPPQQVNEATGEVWSLLDPSGLLPEAGAPRASQGHQEAPSGVKKGADSNT